MKHAGLPLRIFGACSILLALSLAATLLLAESRIRGLHRSDVEVRLEAIARLLESRAAAALESGAVPANLREEWRASLASLGLRLTLVAADGGVLFDTEAELPLENHGNRPEVREAAERGRGIASRRSATTNQETLYLARRIDGPGGKGRGFVRAAADLDRAGVETAAFRRDLLLGAGVALLAGLVLSAWLARRIAQPIRRMEEAAVRFSEGNFESPIRPEGPGEVRMLADSLNRMARDLQDRIRALEEARREIEAILSGMAEGLVAVDASERILLMNGPAAALLGLARPLPAGASAWEAVRFPEFETAIRTVLGGGPSVRIEASCPARDGRILRLSVACLGADAGAVAVFEDVSDVRRLEKIREDFVANVSHEIRSPLAALLGAVETLETSGANPEAREKFLGMARRNAERIQALASDLLDLSAIEADEGRMPMDIVDAAFPLRAAGDAIASRALKKGIQFSVETPQGASLRIRANARRLEQALSNLLDNAVKYTPDGGKVVARLRAEGPEIVYEIEDDGPGIPAAAIPRLFERFFRVDRSRSREMGGTGLGLAIVKHIARAHGGKVTVKSEEGAGACFAIRLPGGDLQDGHAPLTNP